MQEYYEYEVEADSAEEAKRKALQEYELSDDADAYHAPEVHPRPHFGPCSIWDTAWISGGLGVLTDSAESAGGCLGLRYPGSLMAKTTPESPLGP
jgi:hypothetical protein